MSVTLDNKRRYARVLLRVGVDLKEGQSLFVEAPAGQEEFIAILAEEAYAMGCPDVGVLWRSDLTDAARLRAGAGSQDRVPKETDGGNQSRLLRLKLIWLGRISQFASFSEPCRLIL